MRFFQLQLTIYASQNTVDTRTTRIFKTKGVASAELGHAAAIFSIKL